MKIIKQIGIVFAVCWLSVLVEKILPFAFPASVIGMILLFICLLSGALKIEHIQEKSDFLLENMAFFFIPAGVSIINYFDVLKNAWLQLILVCVLSTVITFAVTAWTVRLTMRLTAGFRMKDQREEKKND
ncbi:MAG TPA: CidA/LrgA family protein [Candidatus Mediterraneibacter excrementavium]|nr:CidA/LrgA family protein [Candidatus Mediterraneibacter excrementavium]